jgi:hypothetical protein
MQRSSLSGATVGFIARLLPLYVEERRGELLCARSLRDGTVLMPVAEPLDDDQEGWVCVHWQGDSERQAVIKGVFLARLALVEFVIFHGAGRPERIRAELAHLAQHFELKTGSSLGMDHEQPIDDLIRQTIKLADKLSIPAAIAAIKGLMG